jgi:D-alanine-D-alanine ligase
MPPVTSTRAERGFFDGSHARGYGWIMSGSKQRIGVLLDGLSRHREASVRAGEAILSVLGDAGHDARPVFVDRDLDVALRQGRFDLAFLATRGRYGGDGCLQGLLELLRIPYTGSGVLASALAMNQAKAREILRLHNLPTAPAYVVRADAGRASQDAHGAFGFPVTVAPAGTGLCVGSCVARDELELEAALDEAFRFGDEVLVERFVDGRVVAVGVLDGAPLGAADLGPVVDHLDIGIAPVVDRGEAGGRTRLSPARYRSLLRMAQLTCEALGVEGPALVEMVVSERLNEVVRGVETSPSLAPQGLFARIADGAGLGFAGLVEEVLAGARLRAHGRRRERRATQVGFDGPERRDGLSALPH